MDARAATRLARAASASSPEILRRVASSVAPGASCGTDRGTGAGTRSAGAAAAPAPTTADVRAAADNVTVARRDVRRFMRPHCTRRAGTHRFWRSPLPAGEEAGGGEKGAGGGGRLGGHVV